MQTCCLFNFLDKIWNAVREFFICVAAFFGCIRIEPPEPPVVVRQLPVVTQEDVENYVAGLNAIREGRGALREGGENGIAQVRGGIDLSGQNRVIRNNRAFHNLLETVNIGVYAQYGLMDWQDLTIILPQHKLAVFGEDVQRAMDPCETFDIHFNLHIQNELLDNRRCNVVAHPWVFPGRAGVFNERRYPQVGAFEMQGVRPVVLPPPRIIARPDQPPVPVAVVNNPRPRPALPRPNPSIAENRCAAQLVFAHRGGGGDMAMSPNNGAFERTQDLSSFVTVIRRERNDRAAGPRGLLSFSVIVKEGTAIGNAIAEALRGTAQEPVLTIQQFLDRLQGMLDGDLIAAEHRLVINRIIEVLRAPQEQATPLLELDALDNAEVVVPE